MKRNNEAEVRITTTVETRTLRSVVNHACANVQQKERKVSLEEPRMCIPTAEGK